MADSVILQELFGRLAVLGATAVLAVTLGLVAGRHLESATVPRRLVRRVRWLNTHGPVVLACGVALTLASVFGLAMAHA